MYPDDFDFVLKSIQNYLENMLIFLQRSTLPEKHNPHEFNVHLHLGRLYLDFNLHSTGKQKGTNPHLHNNRQQRPEQFLAATIL